NQRLIESVPMFKDADSQFIEQILAKLRPIVLPPEDYLIHEGQIGHEMYFINHGEVQISKADNTIVGIMKSGSFFGEIALLDSVRRTASVKTLTYCELFVLERDDFVQAMADYPDFADKIKEKAEERRQTNQSDSG
ncbi:TPA: cyclic nucleotide-binding domain-containing protein, partial [Candidatus Poribacteria bacterium]|nr:cyclic nucleotide-binding domain-containing protein [Candidatus Poribacteria bacterium]